MLGDEVLGAAGIPRPPYYAMLRRADWLLTAPHDDALTTTVQKGIDSLARLYLSGQSLPKPPPTASTNGGVDTSTGAQGVGQ